ncbi:hypothetical protein JXA47_09615 [Candidatus Sumerlaeota bacterium]|nr:hypothetical protein [Candidatus Sumerlaeota bacterium]
MNARLLYIIDALLIVAIGALVYAILTTSAVEPPPPPNLAAVTPSNPGSIPTETLYIASAAHPDLGTSDIFGVPIPIPPPPPPPPPPEPVPPTLETIIARLEMYSCIAGEVEFEDGLDGQRYIVSVGDVVQLRSNVGVENVDIIVEAIDPYEFRADFSLQWRDEPRQECSLYMFEPLE